MADAETKARHARWALVGWYCAWPFIHLGGATLPRWFFEQVVLGLSVYAIVATKHDELTTARVKVDTEGEGPA